MSYHHKAPSGWKLAFAATRGEWLTLYCDFLCSLLLIALIAASASAEPFSQLFIFGDSLSDVGNLQAAISLYPGPYYYDGRFSNGPVFPEALSVGLGLGPSIRSTAGGNNFAYGGAKTSGTGGIEGFFIRDIDEQVTQFLNTRTADPAALYVVWAGANDLIGGQTNMTVPVNRLQTDMSRLIGAGARHFLVPNLPLLGHTPRYNENPTTRTTYNTRSEQFNATLASMLDGLETSYPAIHLFRFDVAALFNEALTDPAKYGFTNVTDAAAPGLQPGTSLYNTDQIAENPDEYLFWDDLHPTTAAHTMLVQRALQLFAAPGDFNGDASVDEGDYVVWRRGLAVDSTPENYELWRMHFGHLTAETALLPTTSVNTVPEPEAVQIALLSWVALLMFRLRQLRSVSTDHRIHPKILAIRTRV